MCKRPTEGRRAVERAYSTPCTYIEIEIQSRLITPKTRSTAAGETHLTPCSRTLTAIQRIRIFLQNIGAKVHEMGASGLFLVLRDAAQHAWDITKENPAPMREKIH